MEELRKARALEDESDAMKALEEATEKTVLLGS